jgi:hypothetical protein
MPDEMTYCGRLWTLRRNGEIARAEVIQLEGAGLELRYTRNDKSFVRRMFTDGADLLREAAVGRFATAGAPVHVPTRPRDRSKHDRAERPSDRNRRVCLGRERGMTRAQLEAKRLALLAEGEALMKAYDRLRLTPADRPDHAEHRHRIRLHHQCVRTYLRDLHRRADD